MNRGVFFTLLCCFFFTSSFTQSFPDYNRADVVAKTTPDEAEQSINLLSDYFRSNLTGQKELIRAFYFWTANEIVYDVENMYNFRASDDTISTLVKTLRDKRAVCEGYSAVFHSLCDLSGIESYVVHGYTRQLGEIVNTPHAWILVHLDSSWYFLDPTWGSGYFMDGRYNQKFTNQYFMVKPVDNIKSHMPFDPLWQCLFYPVTPENFKEQTLPEKESSRYFYFPDSIAVYNGLSKSEKFTAAMRRIDANGVTSKIVSDYRQYLNQSIEIERINRENAIKNELVEKFNLSVNYYNSAVTLFTQYVSYRNSQFKPAKPDAEIMLMVDTCDILLGKSRTILQNMVTNDENLKYNRKSMLQSLDQIQKSVDGQQKFVSEYIATPKSQRWSMFGRRW